MIKRLSVRSRGVAQPGRAPGSGPGGRRFESSRPDHFPAVPDGQPKEGGRFQFSANRQIAIIGATVRQVRTTAPIAFIILTGVSLHIATSGLVCCGSGDPGSVTRAVPVVLSDENTIHLRGKRRDVKQMSY